MENIEVLVSRNSSEELIKKSLNNRISVANFAVSSDYKVYIDHNISHEPVEKDNEITIDNKLFSGNIGIYNKDIIIRFKSGGLAFNYLINREVDEDGLLKVEDDDYLRLMNSIERGIRDYLLRII